MPNYGKNVIRITYDEKRYSSPSVAVVVYRHHNNIMCSIAGSRRLVDAENRSCVETERFPNDAHGLIIPPPLLFTGRSGNIFTTDYSGSMASSNRWQQQQRRSMLINPVNSRRPVTVLRLRHSRTRVHPVLPPPPHHHYCSKTRGPCNERAHYNVHARARACVCICMHYIRIMYMSVHAYTCVLYTWFCFLTLRTDTLKWHCRGCNVDLLCSAVRAEDQNIVSFRVAYMVTSQFADSFIHNAI